MLACTVYAITKAQSVNLSQHMLRFAGSNVVKVKGNKITLCNGVRFASASFKQAAHKTAYVFQIVLL